MVGNDSKLAHFFRNTVAVPRILEEFHDIRKRPRIRLRVILLSVFLMPFWGLTALLRLDIHLRTPAMLRLFGCTPEKKVVVSDSTIARVLRWLDPEQTRRALLAPTGALDAKGLMQRTLGAKSANRRIGVWDGSQMGKHYVVAALLCGKVNYPVLIESCPGRGHEMKTVHRWLPILHRRLGPAAPELWLFDALYFTQSTFECVESVDAHLLIKYTPHDEASDATLFRDVLEDAKALFSARSTAVDPIEHAEGFDQQRCCSWSMKKTSAEFAGRPVNIFFLTEDYPKRKKNAHVETWIITTDLTLRFEEAREAAHLRWNIENNEFKRLSHLAGTKTAYFKDARQQLSLLRLFCLALAVFDAFLCIVRHDESDAKALLQGCKFTWKSAFSQLMWQCADALEYLTTAVV